MRATQHHQMSMSHPFFPLNFLLFLIDLSVPSEKATPKQDSSVSRNDILLGLTRWLSLNRITNLKGDYYNALITNNNIHTSINTITTFLNTVISYCLLILMSHLAFLCCISFITLPYLLTGPTRNKHAIHQPTNFHLTSNHNQAHCNHNSLQWWDFWPAQWYASYVNYASNRKHLFSVINKRSNKRTHGAIPYLLLGHGDSMCHNGQNGCLVDSITDSGFKCQRHWRDGTPQLITLR